MKVKLLQNVITIILLCLYSLTAKAQSRDSVIVDLISSPQCHISDREIIRWYERMTRTYGLTISFEPFRLKKDRLYKYSQSDSGTIEFFFSRAARFEFSLKNRNLLPADLYAVAICSGRHLDQPCSLMKPALLNNFTEKYFNRAGHLAHPKELFSKSQLFYLTLIYSDEDRLIPLTPGTRSKVTQLLRNSYGAKYGRPHLAELVVNQGLKIIRQLGSLPSRLKKERLEVDLPHLGDVKCE